MLTQPVSPALQPRVPTNDRKLLNKVIQNLKNIEDQLMKAMQIQEDPMHPRLQGEQRPAWTMTTDRSPIPK